MSITQLLFFLETKLPELSWSLSPNLTLGIICTNTFELSKNPDKLASFSQKLQTGLLNFSADQSLQEKLEHLVDLKNPAELASHLAPILEIFCQDQNLQIQAAGPYLNLDLSPQKWQEFLVN